MSSNVDARTEYDRKIFWRLGLMMIVWIILLVGAGLALLAFGGALEAIFV